METRANYVLIGLFTLAVVASLFGFVYWFQNTGGTGERAWYRVVFDGSVSGLRTGGAVLFNGIRVGEVSGLKLDPQRPQQVIATISIDKSVAVRPDTEVSLEFQGLTGIASLALKGGDPSRPALAGSKDNPPVLTAPPGAAADITQTARDVLRKLDTLLTENQATLSSALKNIDRFTATLAENSRRIDNALAHIDEFTGALARNAERVDKIVAGIQSLSGGDDGRSGQLNEAARSIRALADNLDRRTAEISSGINQLTAAGTREIRGLASDAHRTLSTIDRAVSNLDRNPSRIIFGGRGSSLPEYRGR
jgi:phospholipid/cholesterol/gamma-HCH transport system substrate-binding protein